MRKHAGTAALALILAACGAPPARAPAPGALSAAPEAPPPGAYRIDSAHSELRVLVYRAGVMAALGHDHVVVNRALAGWVSPAGSATGAAFCLRIPTAGFVVDEQAPRAEEGPDFAEEVSQDAKAGTLHNMLSPAILDADNHPAITVQSVSISLPTGQATVRISVAGHVSSLAVPFTVDTSAEGLHARGTFAVRQSALGLAPFTALLGALRVEDELRVKLDLLAGRN